MTIKDYFQKYFKVNEFDDKTELIEDMDALLRAELLKFLEDFHEVYVNRYGEIEIDPPDDVKDTNKWVVDEYMDGFVQKEM